MKYSNLIIERNEQLNINLLSERYMNDGNPALSLSDIQKEYIRLFNNKCKNGDYSFRSLECECGNSDFEVIAQKDRYGIPVDTVIIPSTIMNILLSIETRLNPPTKTSLREKMKPDILSVL